jgi:hypothetical protein
MHSEIQNITPYYSKFENILPEELPDTGVTEELVRARNEINNIIEEDLKKIKDLATRQNRSIMFNEFTKPPSVIRMAFYIEGESSYDDVSFYYAHWTMSFSTLQSIAQSVINTSTELKTNYNNYLNASTQIQIQIQRQEKGIAFNRFIRSYQEFYGYLINIRNTITQYYDLFVQTCNKIDSNNKEQTLIAYKSDIGYDQLRAATKELLLLGGLGRLAGFALLRSAVEIFITRELFDAKKSNKYSNNQIIFPEKRIPSLTAIWKRIEKLYLERYFKTDSLKRLYAWQSIVAHRGNLAEEYLIWFVYYHTTIEIIGAFKANLRHYRDQILEELLKDGLILIK